MTIGLRVGPGGADGPRRVPTPNLSGETEPFVAVYEGLRRAARGLLRRGAWDERSLDPTGLVHEAAVRLLASEGVRGHADRRYIFGAAVRAMRRVLLDRAKHRQRVKRGGGWRRISLDETIHYVDGRGMDVVELHEAIERLARWSPRQAEAVTLRYFALMKIGEIAAELDVCESTVEDDLKFARAWLRRELGGIDTRPPA